MILFKKKCNYCKEKIEKGDEVWMEVKIPEFINKVRCVFCCMEHANLYVQNIKGTPSRNSCPYCRS